jgi:hypothetical protein
LLRLEVSTTNGTTVNIKGFRAGVQQFSVDDTDAARLTTGSYVGLVTKLDNAGADMKMDDLEASILP